MNLVIYINGSNKNDFKVVRNLISFNHLFPLFCILLLTNNTKITFGIFITNICFEYI